MKYRYKPNQNIEAIDVQHIQHRYNVVSEICNVDLAKCDLNGIALKFKEVD